MLVSPIIVVQADFVRHGIAVEQDTAVLFAFLQYNRAVLLAVDDGVFVLYAWPVEYDLRVFCLADHTGADSNGVYNFPCGTYANCV